MANTQAMCTSFKTQMLNGIHAFGTTVIRAGTTKDSFKAALYLTSATVNASTTVYAVGGEVDGPGYTAGGEDVTFDTPPTSTATTAFVTPSASIVYAGVTLAVAFDAVLIYNSTQGNKAVSVHQFTSQTITSGTLTLTMPTNDATFALIRLA